jgi:hypothetical protein
MLVLGALFAIALCFNHPAVLGGFMLALLAVAGAAHRGVPNIVALHFRHSDAIMCVITIAAVIEGPP